MSAALHGAADNQFDVELFPNRILCSLAFDCLGVVGHRVRYRDVSILILRLVGVCNLRKRERAGVIDVRAAAAAGLIRFNDKVVELDLKKRLGCFVTGRFSTRELGRSKVIPKEKELKCTLPPLRPLPAVHELVFDSPHDQFWICMVPSRPSVFTMTSPLISPIFK